MKVKKIKKIEKFFLMPIDVNSIILYAAYIHISLNDDMLILLSFFWMKWGFRSHNMINKPKITNLNYKNNLRLF